MVCDCDLGCSFHADTLVEYMGLVGGEDLGRDRNEGRFDAKSEAYISEGFATDIGADPDAPLAPSFNPDVTTIHETVLSCAARLHDERPSWLPSCLRLIVMIRSAQSQVFWHMFSGNAGPTRACFRHKWPCPPPIDIL